MCITPMATVFGFLSAAATADPFDGFWRGTAECNPIRKEEILIFNNEWVSVMDDKICTMVRGTLIRDMEKTVLYDFECSSEGTVYSYFHGLFSITSRGQLLAYNQDHVALRERCK